MTPLSLTTGSSARGFNKAAGAFLILLSLAILTGCQGVSAGGSSKIVDGGSGTLTLANASLAFGNVTPGSSKSITVHATNSGTATLNITSVALSTKYFSVTSPSVPVSIGAGQSAAVTVMFSPNAAGTFNATMTVTSDASDSSVSVSLTGTGSSGSTTPGTLAANSTTEDFGSVVDGSTQTQSVTLSNTSSSAVDISQVAVTGAGFQVSGITAPLTLNASQSATFSISFAPQTAGAVTGAVTVTSDASNPTVTVALSGTGIQPGALGANPTTLSFGSRPVGADPTQAEFVTNTGTSSITISQIAISGAGFVIDGVTTPITLPAGQTLQFIVGFNPGTIATDTGTVTVTSTALNPTLTIPVSGSGVAAVGALVPTLPSLSFGTVPTSADPTLSETLTNAGTTSITVSQVAASGTGFSVSGINLPVTLSAGTSVAFSVNFDPQSAGVATGSVTVTSTAANPTLAIPLAGTGVAPGALGANPTTLSFGSVLVGQNQALPEMVTNTGGTSVTISQVAASGTGFSVSGITPPVTLAAGASATFSVRFTPASSGSASGGVTVTSNGTNPSLAIALSGTGTTAAGTLAVTPTTMPIGSVNVGSDGTGSGSLMATGSNVTVTSISSSNAAFVVSGVTLPTTITAGNSLPFTVTFTPTATGAANATVTFTSNAQPTTTQETVTGTGTTAPVHTVSLSWNPSSSNDVAGYNVYRASYSTSCGAFARINSSLATSTAYTDSVVSDGEAYCYAATTVDTSDLESTYSNIVSNVQIP
jgi:hypothetical protein